jgi:hypothetical protein
MAKDKHEQLYSILLEMKEDIGRIEGKVDYSIKLGEKTNGRVSTLEAFKENLQGKAAIIVIVGGFIFNMLWGWIKTRIEL